jgi:protein associated with RNAse G/E
VFASLIGRGLELEPPRLEVQKYMLDGSLKIRYWGKLIGASQNERLIWAVGHFDHQIFGDYWLREGDEYFEWYSSLKGYNILEIHERHSKQIKFWYCNLCCPARFVGQAIVWTDLALDLMVTPQKRFVLLDQDELALLNLGWAAYAEVWKNVLDLLKRFQE